MKCKLKDLYNVIDGNQILTVEITEGDAGAWMDEYGDREVELSISSSRKRSNDANAYAWVLIGKLAAKTRQKKEDVYRHIIRDIGDNYEIIRMPYSAIDTFRNAWKKDHIGRVVDMLDSDGKNADVIVYYGSSDYDTKQMTVFIDSVIAECKEQGIETITPREREELLRMWGERYGRVS